MTETNTAHGKQSAAEEAAAVEEKWVTGESGSSTATETVEPETTESEPAELEAAETEAAEPRRPRSRAASLLRVKVLVPSLAFLLVLAAAIVFGIGYFQLNSAESDRSTALQSGNRILKNLGTFDYQNMDKNIDSVTGDASKGFRPQYERMVDMLRGKVKELKATSKLDVVGSGLSRMQGEKANLLFVANQTVTNAQHKEPMVTPWQAQVTLVRQDGTWKLDGMSFVN